MTRQNKYRRHSKLSEAKIRQLARYFVLDLQAIQITAILQAIVKGKVAFESALHSDGWRDIMDSRSWIQKTLPG
jgi:hypothetical protein